MIIKVKLWGAYRKCELMRAYRSKATGELGYVDVRITIGDQRVQGMPADWKSVPVANVRKADRAVVAATLPPPKVIA